MFVYFLQNLMELCTHVDLFVPLGPMVQPTFHLKLFLEMFSKIVRNFTKKCEKCIFPVENHFEQNSDFGVPGSLSSLAPLARDG